MTAPVRPRAVMSDISPGALLVPPVVATALLWLTSPNPVETQGGIYAFVLLLIPWGSYLCWRQGRRDELPIFAMVAAAYWVYFALALFWGQRGFVGAAAFAMITPPENVVTSVVRMALVGVACLWLGMRTPVRIWVPEHLPDIVDRPANWTYVRLVLIAGLALAVRAGSTYMLGVDARQLMTTLVSVVPDVAFVLLFNRYLSGTATRLDRGLLIGCGGVRVLGGLASGWLGPVVAWGVTCGALVLLKRRRFPWVPVMGTVLALVFLQVGKNDFRSEYWSGQDTQAGIVERVQFWVGRSAALWGDALASGDRTNSLGLASKSLERASLLTQVAHVLEMTPEVVPFQRGGTYKFLAITLIPRIVWPDKPSVSEANQFYQVAYGLTTENHLTNVSIAVGALAEGYINFGWAGVIGIMFLIGIVLGIYQRTFAASQASGLFLAVGLTMVAGFLSVEWQLAQYFGGLIQQTALAVAVFLPVTKRRGFTGAPARGLAEVPVFSR